MNEKVIENIAKIRNNYLKRISFRSQPYEQGLANVQKLFSESSFIGLLKSLKITIEDDEDDIIISLRDIVFNDLGLGGLFKVKKITAIVHWTGQYITVMFNTEKEEDKIHPQIAYKELGYYRDGVYSPYKNHWHAFCLGKFNPTDLFTNNLINFFISLRSFLSNSGDQSVLSGHGTSWKSSSRK